MRLTRKLSTDPANCAASCSEPCAVVAMFWPSCESARVGERRQQIATRCRRAGDERLVRDLCGTYDAARAPRARIVLLVQQVARRAPHLRERRCALLVSRPRRVCEARAVSQQRLPGRVVELRIDSGGHVPYVLASDEPKIIGRLRGDVVRSASAAPGARGGGGGVGAASMRGHADTLPPVARMTQRVTDKIFRTRSDHDR